MKLSHLPLLVLSVFFVACGAPDLRYSVTIKDTAKPERTQELIQASKGVLRSRAESIGAIVDAITTDVVDGKTIYTLEVANEGNPDAITEALNSPFTLEVMSQTDDLENADIVVFETEGYVSTGITEKHIEWLEPTEEPGGTGRVAIILTEEGLSKMSEVFSENNGKNIGIFVRDRLIAKLLVEADELKDDIIISSIPSIDLAKVFANDVNVGLYVTFTYLQ